MDNPVTMVTVVVASAILISPIVRACAKSIIEYYFERKLDNIGKVLSAVGNAIDKKTAEITSTLEALRKQQGGL